MVNEPSVFKSLKFYCVMIFFYLILFINFPVLIMECLLSSFELLHTSLFSGFRDRSAVLADYMFRVGTDKYPIPGVGLQAFQQGTVCLTEKRKLTHID